MKSLLARFNLLVGLSAFVLVTLCFVQLAAHAHEPQPKSPILRATTTGINPTLLSDHRDGPLFPPPGKDASLAFSQTLSVKLTNLIKVKGQGPVAIFARVRLSDPQGGLIAQSEEVRIPLRGSYSFTFKRAALRFPGERGTGRLPMLVNGWVRYEYRSHDRDSEDAYQFIRDARATGLLPVLMQLINESNGRTIPLYQDGQKKARFAADNGNAPGGPGFDSIRSLGPLAASDSRAQTNKTARVVRPELRIKQFIFPPTNDKVLHVHVVNTGQAPSAACPLLLTVRKINGVAVGRKTHVTVPALAAGADTWIHIDAKSILPNNVPLQSTTFKLNVDATEIVAESNEANKEVWHGLPATAEIGKAIGGYANDGGGEAAGEAEATDTQKLSTEPRERSKLSCRNVSARWQVCGSGNRTRFVAGVGIRFNQLDPNGKRIASRSYENCSELAADPTIPGDIRTQAAGPCKLVLQLAAKEAAVQ